MIQDKTIDEALIEIMRTKKALEALRRARKDKTKRCWRHSCEKYMQDVPLHCMRCSECNELLYEHGPESQAHAAALRASMDLTRKLADLRTGR